MPHSSSFVTFPTRLSMAYIISLCHKNHKQRPGRALASASQIDPRCLFKEVNSLSVALRASHADLEKSLLSWKIKVFCRSLGESGYKQEIGPREVCATSGAT